MPRLATTTLLIVLGCLGVPGLAAAQEKEPPKLTEDQRKELLQQRKDLNAEGFKQYRGGRGMEALKAWQQALEITERLYPQAAYPKGHADLAASINNLAAALLALGKSREALPYCERAVAMAESLYEKTDHPQMALTLNNLSAVLVALGEPRKALPHDERALAITERLHDKKDHPDLAQCLNNMGFVLQAVGEAPKALPYFDRALAMTERLHDKKDHPDLARGLNNLGSVLKVLGEYRKSLDYYERSLAMQERLYPRKDFPELAATLNNVGGVLQALGETRKALPYLERSLAMRERLYDNKDHPALALSLNALGSALKAVGEPRKALPYFERALAMHERLYDKKDHPDLAATLSNMGGVLVALEEPRKALPYYERALAMQERLHDKQDHPDLALTLNNTGWVLQVLGKGAQALPYYERALAMYERLYDKKDHPGLATAVNNLGFLFLAQGESRKALPYFERALAMQRSRIADRALSAAEAELLTFVAAFPRTRDGYLSASLGVEASEGAAYAQVWQDKAHLTHILQARHLAARAATSDKTRAAWEQLRQARRNLALVVNTPSLPKEDRDKQLRTLTDTKEKLERQLVELLPEYQALHRSDSQSLDDLAKALPAQTAFVDLLRYYRYDKESCTLHYVAFVLTGGKTTQRVELGAADDIDAALAQWLEYINAWKPGLSPREEKDLLDETDRRGQKVTKLVWTPLAGKIPARAVVYISTGGDLSRLPWAALPVDGDGVLLQKHLICQVPHGPFLLERLIGKEKADDGKGKLLAVGGVDYGSADKPRFGNLPGTETELKQVLALAGKRDKAGLSGREASTAAVLKELGQARYLHLATHGEFKAALLAEERQRVDEQLKRWEYNPGSHTSAVGLGLRSPLSYVGVALAGANQPDKAGPDGGVLSGEAIVESDLAGLRLCVLSACETGLGAYTQAEGVQGLVRAFHVAGCPNVVASLWKVNDDATAALMAKFYRELWEGGKSPAEALRAAQLLLYTQPEVVGPLVRGERGAPDFDKAVQTDPSKAEPPKGKRLPPKLWAAFLLSGVGQQGRVLR